MPKKPNGDKTLGYLITRDEYFDPKIHTDVDPITLQGTIRTDEGTWAEGRVLNLLEHVRTVYLLSWNVLTPFIIGLGG